MEEESEESRQDLMAALTRIVLELQMLCTTFTGQSSQKCKVHVSRTQCTVLLSVLPVLFHL